jgi:hypothetical protein
MKEYVSGLYSIIENNINAFSLFSIIVTVYYSFILETEMSHFKLPWFGYKIRGISCVRNRKSVSSV